MDTVARAKSFVEQHGRDVDRARMVYHFGGGAQTALLAALGRYQNPDGGFGHGLEPDIAAPDSNPSATQLALLICVQAGIPGEDPLLQRTVEYLERTQDDVGGWRFSQAVYAHDMAPWYAGWQWPSINPACAIAGLLKELGLGSERLHTQVEGLFERLARVDDLAGDDYYAVLPYAYYFLPEWEHPQRALYASGVAWWLIRQHVQDKLPDSQHFFEYIRTPDTYIGRLMPAPMAAVRLDRLEAEQAEDGGWPSPYAEHWRAWVTVQNLLTLRAFGRI